MTRQPHSGETVVRIKQNSIDYRSKHLAPTDMEGMMRIIEDKRALEELPKNTRIKRKIKWQRKGTKRHGTGAGAETEFPAEAY